jgi:hypothetical protein
MRLLRAADLKLCESRDDEIPKYAILSHTWGAEEVTLRDMQNVCAKDLLGYKKLELCCQQAVRDDVRYAWVDTCCIDKSSSAELSEAINSMYQWYQAAHVCYAYLEDVPADGQPSDMPRSRWFTRGWTLQELIAPQRVIFYG